MPPQNQYDILIRYLGDSKGADESTEDVIRDLKKAEDGLRKLSEQFKATGVFTDEMSKDAAKFAEAYINAENKMSDAVSATQVKLKAEAKLLRAEIAGSQSDLLNAQIARQNQLASQIGGISRGALGLGLGITGGIFAAASKYVKDAKEATEVTRQWKEEQDSLAASGEKIGRSFAEASLPLLKIAADVADRVSQFVDDHPDVVSAALNTGVALATLGAVGIAVSKGIKIVADVKALSLVSGQLNAARLQDLAADKQLLAAKLRAKELGIDITGLKTAAPAAAGGATVGGIAGAAAVLTGALAIGTIVGDRIFDKLEGRDVQFKDYITTFKQAITIDAGKLGALFGKSDEWFKSVGIALGLLQNDAEKAAAAVTGVAASPALDGILKAYEDYKRDDLKMVQDHYNDRKKITDDALKAERAENARFAESTRRINSQRQSALASEAASFASANEKADRDYQTQRATITRDGDLEIVRIREESQERLRKLESDHAERADELTRARDALGLVKEQRRFRAERSEELRSTANEIRQRRQDIAIRLADLQRGYEEERAQRAAEHQARVSEIIAQAREQLIELQKEHAAELREIQIQKVAKIRELDQQFLEERKRRTQYFIQQVRDLDASLLGEKNLKEQYHKAMIADLDKFLSTYQTKLASLSAKAPASKNAGGYAGYGTYLLGDSPGGGRGPREYVMDGHTTAMAERMIGGALTRDRLAAALAFGAGGNRQSVTYNDNKRLDSRIPNADRMLMEDNVIARIKRELRRP